MRLLNWLLRRKPTATAEQLRWTREYIHARYGDVTQAHEQARAWYANPDEALHAIERDLTARNQARAQAQWDEILRDRTTHWHDDTQRAPFPGARITRIPPPEDKP